MGLNSKKLYLSFALLSIYLIIQTDPVFADPDFAHHRNILPGTRAAGLGGAYTGISDDPAGSFYNPAGLVFGKNKEISVSVNSRQEKTLKFKNIAALNGQDFVEKSTTFFPSFVGTNYKIGPISVGWSYMTLDTSNIDQSDRFENLSSSAANTLDSYNRTHQESNSYFLAGGSFAFPIGKHISFGTSLYYYRRDIVATNHQLVRLLDGSFLSSDQKYTTLNEGLYPIYGAMLKTDLFSIGFSTRQPTSLTDHTILYSDGVIFNTSQETPTPVVNSSIFRLGSNNEYNPATHQIGFAWTPAKWFLLSTDIIVHEGISRKKDVTSANDFIQTTNYALGSEIKMGSLAIRNGFFTNNSQTKDLSSENVNQPTHIDYLGTSVSIVLNQKGFSGAITYIEQNGKGKAQKLSDDNDIQTAIGYSRTVQLGAKYDF